MDDSTSDVRAAYERSLRELRQDIGCTPERLMKCPELFAALRRRLTASRIPETAEACVAELKALVETLSDPRYREPLLVALHLNPEYSKHTLTDRRSAYNTDLKRSLDPEQRKLGVDSLRTLERRENEGMETLIRLLIVQEQTSSISTLSRSSAPDARDLVTEAVSHTCYISATGSIDRNEITRWVRAVTPESKNSLTVTHRYFSESRRGVLEILPVFGCRVINVQEDAGGGIISTLEIYQRLAPSDGLYSFGYTIQVHSQARAEPVLRWRALAPYTRRAEFRLIFDDAMTPARAWWMRTVRSVEGEVEPNAAELRHLNILDSGRYVYKSFEAAELAADLYYGVAWAWR